MMQNFTAYRKFQSFRHPVMSFYQIRLPSSYSRTFKPAASRNLRKLSSRGSFAVFPSESVALQRTSSLQWTRITEPLKPYMKLLHEAMTKERKIIITFPLSTAPTCFKTNFSNICGHGSFLMLALGYMETDVLFLRVFSAGGIVMSVLFQYYRPQPLWIPISWNTLFLIINGGMILALINERKEAEHLKSPEEQEVFDARFAKLGLNAVQFLHLIRLSEELILPPRTPLATFGQPLDKIYLIINGTANVFDGDGDEIGHLSNHQFVGSMAFLRYLNTAQDKEQNKNYDKEVLHELMVNLASSFDPEHWEIEPDGGFVAVNSEPLKPSGPSNEEEQLCNSSTSVLTSTECHVFAWDFRELRAYLKGHPLEGNAMQVSISADLTQKLDQSRDPHLRYSQLLKTAISGGELLPCEKNKLRRYREVHGITSDEHDKLLSELGWTAYDYETGYQQTLVTETFAEYEDMLKNELSMNKLDNEGRIRLRRFRKSANIDPQRHLLALAKLGWTYEQYELGMKDDVIVQEKVPLKSDKRMTLQHRVSLIHDSIALARKNSTTE